MAGLRLSRSHPLSRPACIDTVAGLAGKVITLAKLDHRRNPIVSTIKFGLHWPRHNNGFNTLPRLTEIANGKNKSTRGIQKLIGWYGQGTDAQRDIHMPCVFEHGIWVTEYLDTQFYLSMPRSMHLPCQLSFDKAPKLVADDEVAFHVVHPMTTATLSELFVHHAKLRAPRTHQLLLCWPEKIRQELLRRYDLVLDFHWLQKLDLPIPGFWSVWVSAHEVVAVDPPDEPRWCPDLTNRPELRSQYEVYNAREDGIFYSRGFAPDRIDIPLLDIDWTRDYDIPRNLVWTTYPLQDHPDSYFFGTALPSPKSYHQAQMARAAITKIKVKGRPAGNYERQSRLKLEEYFEDTQHYWKRVYEEWRNSSSSATLQNSSEEERRNSSLWSQSQAHRQEGNEQLQATRFADPNEAAPVIAHIRNYENPNRRPPPGLEHPARPLNNAPTQNNASAYGANLPSHQVETGTNRVRTPPGFSSDVRGVYNTLQANEQLSSAAAGYPPWYQAHKKDRVQNQQQLTQHSAGYQEDYYHSPRPFATIAPAVQHWLHSHDFTQYDRSAAEEHEESQTVENNDLVVDSGVELQRIDGNEHDRVGDEVESESGSDFESSSEDSENYHTQDEAEHTADNRLKAPPGISSQARGAYNIQEPSGQANAVTIAGNYANQNSTQHKQTIRYQTGTPIGFSALPQNIASIDQVLHQAFGDRSAAQSQPEFQGHQQAELGPEAESESGSYYDSESDDSDEKGSDSEVELSFPNGDNQIDEGDELQPGRDLESESGYEYESGSDDSEDSRFGYYNLREADENIQQEESSSKLHEEAEYSTQHGADLNIQHEGKYNNQSGLGHSALYGGGGNEQSGLDHNSHYGTEYNAQYMNWQNNQHEAAMSAQYGPGPWNQQAPMDPSYNSQYETTNYGSQYQTALWTQEVRTSLIENLQNRPNYPSQYALGPWNQQASTYNTFIRADDYSVPTPQLRASPLQATIRRPARDYSPYTTSSAHPDEFSPPIVRGVGLFNTSLPKIPTAISNGLDDPFVNPGPTNNAKKAVKIPMYFAKSMRHPIIVARAGERAAEENENTPAFLRQERIGRGFGEVDVEWYADGI